MTFFIFLIAFLFSCTPEVEFFEFKNDDQEYYKMNLERGGNLTTFGTEITFCQFSVFLDIKDNPIAQQKRMLPLRFDEYFDIADVLQKRMNEIDKPTGATNLTNIDASGDVNTESDRININKWFNIYSKK